MKVVDSDDNGRFSWLKCRMYVLRLLQRNSEVFYRQIYFQNVKNQVGHTAKFGYPKGQTESPPGMILSKTFLKSLCFVEFPSTFLQMQSRSCWMHLVILYAKISLLSWYFILCNLKEVRWGQKLYFFLLFAQAYEQSQCYWHLQWSIHSASLFPHIVMWLP